MISGTFCTVVSDHGGLGFHCSMNSAGSTMAAFTSTLGRPRGCWTAVTIGEDETRTVAPPPPLSRSTITSVEGEDLGEATEGDLSNSNLTLAGLWLLRDFLFCGVAEGGVLTSSIGRRWGSW